MTEDKLTECPSKPWERQKGETDAAWSWFQWYRQLGARHSVWPCVGNRSTAKMAVLLREHGYEMPPRKEQLDKLAKRHNWDARARAYDRHMDQIYLSTTEETLRDAAKAHVKTAVRMQDIAGLELTKILDRVKGSAHEGDFKIRDLVRLFEAGVKVERLARGQATERVDDAGTDLSKLTLDELRTLRALKEKSRRE